MKKFLYLFGLLYFFVAIVSVAQAFDEGQCVYNKQYKMLKKITKVRTFVYEFCIFDRDFSCSKKLTTRKDWFNQQHVLTSCPKSGKIEGEIFNEGELPVSKNVKVQVIRNESSTSEAEDTEYFQVHHFTCNHCHKNQIQQEILNKLQALKNHLGFDYDIYITSGYRCKMHNKNIGGVANSQHILGMAADIRIITKDGEWLSGGEIAELVEKSGVFGDGGMGIYDSFVHLDARGEFARWDERSV